MTPGNQIFVAKRPLDIAFITLIFFFFKISLLERPIKTIN